MASTRTRYTTSPPPPLHLGSSNPKAAWTRSISSSKASRRNISAYNEEDEDSTFLPPPTPNAKRSHFAPSRMGISPLSWWRLKRTIFRPIFWVLGALALLIFWWSRGPEAELNSREVQSKLREIFPPEITRDLQYFAASNHKIHYVGRWTSAPNRMRMDGAFPGVYFDLNITNSSTLMLSLQNAKAKLTDESSPDQTDDTRDTGDLPTTGDHRSQYSFTEATRASSAAEPISLLALIDKEEYVLLPDAASLVPVRVKDLNPRITHSIRVIAPMMEDESSGVVQLDGIYLDQGGSLLPVEGSAADRRSDDEDDMDPDGLEVGKMHRIGLDKLLGRHRNDKSQSDNDDETNESVQSIVRRKKLIEIVTDTPAHMAHVKTSSRTGGADSLLSGVMGWEFLLGEMFSVDHVCIGTEGMCLIHDCIGGAGSPSGMGDVFFRSGPVGSVHYGHPWPFQSYVPDVIILNLGSSDHYSFDFHYDEYNATIADFPHSFEDTYVSLVKAIRNLAYPTHPAELEMQRLGVDAYAEDESPATIPIFIMRPFGGELEHATQNAVNRLRVEGDKGVFWLDTTGWLDTSDTETTASDFFWDPDEPEGHPHLTEKGNQKVAIYLHSHVCRYLAAEPQSCAFLPPEAYQGNVYDPAVAKLDRYIENEKERQMKELFWEEIEIVIE